MGVRDDVDGHVVTTDAIGAAIDSALPVHCARVLAYPRASNLQTGLLINFKESALRAGIHRILND